MNDQCRTVMVMLQENGIVRNIKGHIVGRLATMDGLDFNAIPDASQQPDSKVCPNCGKDKATDIHCNHEFHQG